MIARNSFPNQRHHTEKTHQNIWNHSFIKIVRFKVQPRDQEDKTIRNCSLMTSSLNREVKEIS